jgi:hypothetical protein
LRRRAFRIICFETGELNQNIPETSPIAENRAATTINRTTNQGQLELFLLSSSALTRLFGFSTGT